MNSTLDEMGNRHVSVTVGFQKTKRFTEFSVKEVRAGVSFFSEETRPLLHTELRVNRMDLRRPRHELKIWCLHESRALGACVQERDTVTVCLNFQ